jgi:outer membrane usher protein
LKKINKQICLFITFSFLPLSLQANEAELYKKVFGEKIEKKRIGLPLYFQEKFITEIEVDVSGDKIVGFPSNSLIPGLRKIIIESEIKKLIDLKKEYLVISDLGFKLNFNASKLQLELVGEDRIIRPTDSLFQESLIPYFAKDAKKPAPLSGAINWKVEENLNHASNGQNYFVANLSSFVNYHSFVLENQMDYSSDREANKWYRGNTALVKDDESHAVRYSLGDNSSGAYGYKGSQSFGGLSISREYSITPYKIITPGSAQEFTVESRSVVRYYVNNNLLKTEFLNSGKYNVRDIPLNNGVNKIIVEVEDEFGNKKFFNFTQSFSNELLGEGQSKFDVSIGKTSQDQNYKKSYDKSNNIYNSSYYKRGWTNSFTNGFYLQNKSSALLLGTENLFSTAIGNFGVGAARSKHSKVNGTAFNLNYYLSLFANSISNTQSLNLRFEKREKNFNEGLDFSPGRFEYNLSSSYSLPVFNWASLGIGLNYSKPFDKTLFSDKYGIDSSITGRLFKSSSITFYLSNNRDEYKKWNQFFYVFMNFSFDEGYSYVSTFYDSNSEAKRVSYYYDKGKSVDDIKVQAAIEDSKYAKNGEIDLAYNSKLVELGLRETITETSKEKYSGKTSMRALSALTFAKDENNLKFGISRPVSNSFAIISSNEILKGQTLALKSSGNRIIEKSGFLNEIVVRDLIPYQYRRLQLDPTFLKVGFSIKQESFIVYPTYKSGHLILAEALGSIAVKGIMLSKGGEPMSLAVGEVVLSNGTLVPFFTNKAGKFFIEGINPGTMKFLLDDHLGSSVSVTIKSDQSGVVDLGVLKLEGNELKK